MASSTVNNASVAVMPSASEVSPRGPGKTKSSEKGLKILLQNIMFGGTAGVIGQFSIFPMYTAKTNLQQYPNRYRNLLHCLRKIYQHDGTRGLYSGLKPTLTFTFPEKAIKLAVNDFLCAQFARKDGTVPISLGVVAGAGAGLCQVVMTNPMEMLMITMQTREAQGLRPKSMLHLARELGLPRLYRDTPATLLRDIPFSMVFFPLHATLQRRFADNTGNTPVHKVLLSGLISGSTAAALSTPMDVVKTRVMASTGASIAETTPAAATAATATAGATSSAAATARASAQALKAEVTASQYTRILQEARQIAQMEGLGGFFKGVVPRILIISPLFGITTCFYEAQKKFRRMGWL